MLVFLNRNCDQNNLLTFLSHFEELEKLRKMFFISHEKHYLPIIDFCFNARSMYNRCILRSVKIYKQKLKPISFVDFFGNKRLNQSALLISSETKD